MSLSRPADSSITPTSISSERCLASTLNETCKQQVWVGPSGMLDTPHSTFGRKILGIERIVFLIDYPDLTVSAARQWLEAIACRNAEALLHLA